MSKEQLLAMKRQMLAVGNFKEVERINKILKFQTFDEETETEELKAL